LEVAEEQLLHLGGVTQRRQPLPVAAVGDQDGEDATCEGTWVQMNIQWIFGHHVLVIHNPKRFPDFGDLDAQKFFSPIDS